MRKTLQQIYTNVSKHGRRGIVNEMQRPAACEMAGHRLVIQEMMSWGYPAEKICVLQGKDVNKMGRDIAHSMNLMTGPKGCLPNTAREIWIRRLL